MATTQATVCNTALGFIGEQAIAGINDDNPRANALNTHWEPVLRHVLDEAPWRFALKRATLARLSSDPDFSYNFQYQFPPDYVAIVQFNGLNIWNQRSDLFDTESGKLLTNEQEAKIQYVFYQMNTNLWAGSFATAVARLLAARVASTIRQDGAQLANALENRYLTVDLPRARMKNANQMKLTPYNLSANSHWVASRRTSTRG